MLKKYINKHYWWDVQYKISGILKPRQKWLTKQIPKQWCDKVELIRLVLFESVIHFVESEDCFNTIDWEGSSAEHAKAKKTLEEIYNLIKVELPALRQKEEDHWQSRKVIPRFADNLFGEKIVDENGNVSYRMRDFTPEEREYYDISNKIGEEIYNLEQKICEMIVSVRNYMWT